MVGPERHRDDRRGLPVWRGRTTAQRWEWAFVVVALLIVLVVVNMVHR